MAPQFLPGLDLARDFYATVVRPLLEQELPGLGYAAALLGPGSEVAGYDTERSTDHDWGPRLQVFLGDGDAERHAAEPCAAMLAGRLPGEFRGYPVGFPVTREPDGIARHRVEVTGLGAWLTARLGFDPRRAVTLLDWLATPAQRLAEFTTGEVFHDGPGELTRARQHAAWYPHDVWLYVLACQWQRIGQEEPFAGRCAEAGDDARLARRDRPTGPRPDAAVPADAPPVPALQQVAGHRLHPAPRRRRAHRVAERRDPRWRLPGPGAPSDRGAHRRRRAAQPAAAHAAARHPHPPLLRPALPGPWRRPLHRRAARRGHRPAGQEAAAAGAVDQFIDSTDAAGDLGFLRTCTAAAIRQGR